MERAATRSPALSALLAAVHASPGITRADAAAELGMASGYATETVARLVGLRLLEERAAAPTGRRGRPTTALHPHPDGPLVAAAAISHDSWRVAVVELGGGVVRSGAGAHSGDQEEVVRAVAASFDRAWRRYGTRIRAFAAAVPGTVNRNRLVHAPNLDWRDLDLVALRPGRASSVALLGGNDATFAGLAEQRCGAAVGTSTAVHLYLDCGVGGVLVDSGRAVLGTAGAAGEFGHLPFGSSSRRCGCGALGCWNTVLDGAAIARMVGQPAPRNAVAFAAEVLEAAAAGKPVELRAARALGRSLGRGAAGLVNALDPELVTVGGLGPALLAVAGRQVEAAYRRGLMAFRATGAPPIVPARFGADGPLTGAAEEGFARVLTGPGIDEWAALGG
ncbi:ROK family protein [Acidiferrimicrobium sp. IK]|uniref:ROK family transcriptional regulator n=1 Tax=Acidiferrimicrobium sp. IK TaxID=2871700 RepID=UPI0021CB7DD9|nr:ROK family transcriptional regulator [Acidiferrimicrobium sp. IK]MCU4186577.1 ROK family protein [Acidiferrimicrobium sp. IK]